MRCDDRYGRHPLAGSPDARPRARPDAAFGKARAWRPALTRAAAAVASAPIASSSAGQGSNASRQRAHARYGDPGEKARTCRRLSIAIRRRSISTAMSSSDMPPRELMERYLRSFLLPSESVLVCDEGEAGREDAGEREGARDEEGDGGCDGGSETCAAEVSLRGARDWGGTAHEGGVEGPCGAGAPRAGPRGVVEVGEEIGVECVLRATQAQFGIGDGRGRVVVGA